MKMLILLSLAWILSGCSLNGIREHQFSAPDIDDFPPHELPFRVHGDHDYALRDIQDYLSSRGLPSVVTIRAPKTYVVTTYIIEPRQTDDRRIRMTAFRLALSEMTGSYPAPCTSVAISSLTKSRGIREEVWSVQESDATYISSAWPELKTQLEMRACK